MKIKNNKKGTHMEYVPVDSCCCQRTLEQQLLVALMTNTRRP